MSRHKKIAFFVAPFLALGGYILSDMYMEYKANEKRVFELVPEGHCDIIHEKCVLKSGDFKINVYDKNGITSINSTFPLDEVVIFLVDSAKEIQSYPMGMKDSPYYWHRETPLRSRIAEKGQKQKLRVIATIKGGKYISEFYSQTVK
ncbi:hypothetical protein HII17_16220 [Thalassotalea sp. M1531]|uniref:Uncharacterized protein n=1 Tax=Thalassotalea algicola TaxID=2716224 RepID=A0A7Y0LEL8_9GAMM|nr:hypothetical protein [Thalassotalea algicola]NMP33105.1 hypothetical protein [Thalassotalea algicola]